MGGGYAQGRQKGGRARREAGVFALRFRDLGILKSPAFAKGETKMHKLAALRQYAFLFQRKIQKFKNS